jgi:hypothetical protein
MQRISKYLGDFMVFLVAFALFLQTLVANFSGPHDAINYLNGIVNGRDLFHQHHLLYHASAHVWYLWWSKIFSGVESFYLVESFTAFFGALNVWILYRIFRDRFQVPLLHNIVFLLVIVFTYGMWLYSTNVEVYAPPIFFLLCTLYFLSNNNIRKDIVWIALFHSLAILYHQVHIIFAIVVLWKLVQQKSLKTFFVYAGIGTILVGTVYLSIGYFVEGNHTTEDMWKWLSGYTNSDFYWQTPGLEMLVKVFTGFTHAYIGGHFVFQLQPVQDLLKDYTGHSLADEMYLVRNMPSSIAVILSALCIFFAFLFVYLNVQLVKNFKKINIARREVIYPFLIATVCYSIFFCFWMPEILEFWIFQTITIWIILLGSAHLYGFFKKKIHTYLVYALVITLFSINWWGSMKYMRDLNNDLYYVQVKQLDRHLTENTLAVFQDGWILKDFIDYFTPADIIVSPQDSVSHITVDAAIQQAISTGKQLLVFPEKNNYGLVQSTHYLDSLLLQYQSQWTIINEAKPRVLLLKTP